jgi:hypothetical protein
MAETKFGWQRDDIFSEYACDTPRVARLTVTERWPLLLPADIAGAGADRALLTVRIVERYGISHEWAARHIADWDI